MRVRFSLDSLIREVNDGLKYVKVEIEITCAGNIAATIRPPKEFELIILPHNMPILSVEQKGDGEFEATLYSLNKWVKEVREAAKRMDLDCHNLIMHLRQLARGGVK